jgi:hypothetical protein
MAPFYCFFFRLNANSGTARRASDLGLINGSTWPPYSRRIGPSGCICVKTLSVIYANRLRCSDGSGVSVWAFSSGLTACRGLRLRPKVPTRRGGRDRCRPSQRQREQTKAAKGFLRRSERQQARSDEVTPEPLSRRSKETTVTTRSASYLLFRRTDSRQWQSSRTGGLELCNVDRLAAPAALDSTILESNPPRVRIPHRHRR